MIHTHVLNRPGLNVRGPEDGLFIVRDLKSEISESWAGADGFCI